MAVATHTVAGIISGRNPLEYTASNPLTLFLFQAIFIIALCQVVHIPLGWLKQPRVIAEVIAGILLGPTVMGHIPGFTQRCFPTASIPLLTLVANIGVILFLFLVGLEVDVKFIKRNLKIALSVGLINMAIPFGLGCAISKGLYDQYRSKSSDEPAIKFTTYMVFIAVAMCITAFPVLARILTSLRLLQDRVGTVVLAAGITNDVVGWILLALSVTLANSGSGINTLYILLVVIGWALFVLYPVRWFLCKLVMKNDLKNGKLSRFSILTILIFVFISSFFTDIIGAHPIFGAFLVGLIVPRDHGFVVDLTNKIEDLVHIILIPIYFSLAGFNVNLGELNEGIDWGYIIGLIIIAVTGKILGGLFASKLNGLLWRESLAVGVLMSCKGIVEIVVLNVGLQAEIITSKVFSMFIVMTLVATFLTTPMTLLVYPVSYREKVSRYLAGEIDWNGNELNPKNASNTDSQITAQDKFSNDDYSFDKIVYNIDNVDGFYNLLNFLSLFYGCITNTISSSSTDPLKSLFQIIYLQELTERTTDLIGASTSFSQQDLNNSQLEILKKIFEFNDIPFVGDLKYYVKEDKFETFIESTDLSQSNLVVYSTKFKDDIDSKFLERIDTLENSQFMLFYKNNELKHSNVNVILDYENDDNDSILIFLIKQISENSQKNLKSINFYISKIADDRIDESKIYQSVISKIKQSTGNVEIVTNLSFGNDWNELQSGLILAGLNTKNLEEQLEFCSNGEYDLMAVKKC